MSCYPLLCCDVSALHCSRGLRSMAHVHVMAGRCCSHVFGIPKHIAARLQHS